MKTKNMNFKKYENEKYKYQNKKKLHAVKHFVQNRFETHRIHLKIILCPFFKERLLLEMCKVIVTLVAFSIIVRLVIK